MSPVLCVVALLAYLDNPMLAEDRDAEKKSPDKVTATLRAVCEELPVKNLGLRLRLVNIQSGEEHKYSGRTDQNGVFSFEVPPGKYRCGRINMSTSSGQYKPLGPATAIVGSDGDKKFNLGDYFNEAIFWRSREEIVSLGPEDFEFPDIEYIPRFEIVFPANGNTVEERPPVFRWESVKGTESYRLEINEKTRLKGRSRGLKSIFRKANIRSTEYRADTPLLEAGKEYSLHVTAVDSEGGTINRSKVTTFTMAGGDGE